MLLAHDYHRRFDRMEFYFEPVDGAPHTYTLGAESELSRAKLPARTVAFRAHPTIERPPPELLCIKRALAKVLHSSGAAACIARTFRDIDDGVAVASDGSTNLEGLLTLASLSKLGPILVN